MRATGSFAAVVAAALLSTACADPPPPPRESLDAEAVRALFDRMDRLVTALEGMPALRPVAHGGWQPDGQRTEVVEDRDELLRRIEQLEAALVAVQSRGGGGHGPTPVLVPPSPMRQREVEQLAMRVSGEDPSGLREMQQRHFRHTEAQVLQEFGMPTNVYVHDGSVRWHYESGEHDFTLVFVDGRVNKIFP